jgi:hypothetical protein
MQGNLLEELSICIQGIFLKLHAQLWAPMGHNTLKFGRDWSIIKGTLHEVQITFSPISLILFVWFSLKPISFVQPSWRTTLVTFVTIGVK